MRTIKHAHARSHKTNGNSHLRAAAVTSTYIGDAIRDVGHKIDELTERAALQSDKLIQRSNSVASDMQGEISRISEPMIKYVKKNPGKSVAIALATGYTLARLLKLLRF